MDKSSFVIRCISDTMLCSYVCIFHIPYHSECNVNIELYYADDLTPAKHNRDWHRVTEPIVYIIRIHNTSGECAVGMQTGVSARR